MNPTSGPILAAGFPLGSSAGLVTAFEWLGQPYRITRVDMLGEMRSDAYKRLNGRVETPVLITEAGQVITETMAIALWLEARDTERRISFEPGTRQADRLHQYLAFLNTGFTGAFYPCGSRWKRRKPPKARRKPCASSAANSSPCGMRNSKR